MDLTLVGNLYDIELTICLEYYIGDVSCKIETFQAEIKECEVLTFEIAGEQIATSATIFADIITYNMNSYTQTPNCEYEMTF